MEGGKPKVAWEAESLPAAGEEPGLHVLFSGPRAPDIASLLQKGRKRLMSRRQRKCENRGLVPREKEEVSLPSREHWAGSHRSPTWWQSERRGPQGQARGGPSLLGRQSLD